jgi:hypothetical protein
MGGKFLVAMVVRRWAQLPESSSFNTTIRRAQVAYISQQREVSPPPGEGGGETKGRLYAVIRIDTHGCKAIVKEKISYEEARDLEQYYDSLNHHQGYFLIDQSDLKIELCKK